MMIWIKQWQEYLQRNWLVASTSLRIWLGCATAFVIVVLVAFLMSRQSSQLSPPTPSVPPDGYLFTSSNEVDFAQFTTDQAGQVSGNIATVWVDNKEQIQSSHTAFTGVQAGTKITWTFATHVTRTGNFLGSVLSLQIPNQQGYITTDTFHAASTAEYNRAVTTLRQQATTLAAATQSTEATATIQANLDQGVAQTNAQLAHDLSTTKGDVQSLEKDTNFTSALTSYGKDWQQMEADYQHEQADYQNGCGTNGYNAGVVSYDAGTVNYDLGTIQYDDGTINYDVNTMKTPLDAVQKDIVTIQNDWQYVQTAIAADPTGANTTPYSAQDIASVVSNTQSQINTSNQDYQTAKGQANQYDQEAQHINTEAANLASGMHC